MVASHSEHLDRIDANTKIIQELRKYCRLKKGEIWTDDRSGHQVAVLDACEKASYQVLTDSHYQLIIADPPYNIQLDKKKSKQLFSVDLEQYLKFSKAWISNSLEKCAQNASFYLWLGADQNNHFQPLPDVQILMRGFEDWNSRSYITLRNQRGYGTSKNWMSVRQELLYYIKGKPKFSVQYTDIPRILKGYYKKIDGNLVDNDSRSKSETIRASNVWVDIQQVFYRMNENVAGAYAQKPLKSIVRIIEASSEPGDSILDPFCHSGTTLLAAEMSSRRCHTFDIEPVFAELSIRRLEQFRKTGKTGWQWNNPFPEIEK